MSIGLYIHVPFCLKKCLYCDFASIPLRDGTASCYREALFKEIEIRAGMLTAEEKSVDSIYVGGGTPTCLPGDDLARLLEKVFLHFKISSGAEITVEANPGTVDLIKLTALRQKGFNRISIGFQSCQQQLLDTLGRIHTFSQAREAFYAAGDAGFDNINADLIFGIPGQTCRQWESCLGVVAELRPQHISAYSLQLEEGTPLYESVRGGRLAQCPEDREAEMYGLTIDFLKGKGYRHYEISNFALPGRACRHNMRYWNNGAYLGLGPSAHSHLGGRRFSNAPDLKRYMEVLKAGSLPVDMAESVDERTAMSETVFLGLRLIEGLDLDDFRKRFGRDIGEVYGEEIARLLDQGLLEREGRSLRLTLRGLMLGNRVFTEFV